jgi:hypothetical protein
VGHGSPAADNIDFVDNKQCITHECRVHNVESADE